MRPLRKTNNSNDTDLMPDPSYPVQYECDFCDRTVEVTAEEAQHSGAPRDPEVAVEQVHGWTIGPTENWCGLCDHLDELDT